MSPPPTHPPHAGSSSTIVNPPQPASLSDDSSSEDGGGPDNDNDSLGREGGDELEGNEDGDGGDRSIEGQREDEVFTPVDPPYGVRMTDEIRREVTKRGKPMINQYIRGPQVGKGQHGEVYLAWDVSNNSQQVAIKAVKRRNPRAEKFKKMRRNNPLPLPPASHIPLVDKLTSTEQKIRKEIAIMKKLRHAHVVRLLEVIDDKQYGRIFMVMEYLGGGEVKWRNMDNEPILTVDQTRRIIRDVILGLEYLHYQGIIHRDIKPANLMYTSDRRSVKITDFGVSHFSYAQRLAAATTPYDASDDDPILMDESDLSKMAGTPPFMAPEVIWEMKDTSGGSVSGSASVSGSSSVASTLTVDGTVHHPNLYNPHHHAHHHSHSHHAQTPSSSSSTPPNKKTITKAIDVWALGVTLFSLLFARVPFFDPDFNEWRLYRLICNEEWEVDETMGVDKVVTGGRRRGRGKGKEEEGEGAVVVGLLERLLEKDANKRIKLAQVKSHPWFLRDIPNPDAWLRETSPNKVGQVMVTEDETSDAMSSVRFRWTRRIMKPINSFINTMVRPPKIIRPVRSFRSAGDGSFHGADEELMSAGAVGRNGLGLSSVVNVGLNGPRQRVKSASGGAKKKLGIRTGTFRNGNASGSNVTGGGVPRSKSIDRLPPMPKHHGSIGGSTPKARRGSETLLAPPSRPCIGGAVTPYSVSPTSSTIADEHVFFGTEKNLHHPPEEKSSGGGKNRFSLSAWKPWKPSRPTSLGPLPHEVSTTSSTPAPVMRHFGGRPVQDFYARRSEEAFSGSVSAGPSRVSSMDKDKGILTATMRASSWGETAEYARQSEDITSIHSGDRWDDAVDDEVMHLGAGGVSDDPNLPSFHISAASSSLRMGGAKPTPLPLLQPQPERFFDEPGGSLPLIADPAMQDIVRQGSRSHAMSPLAQVSYYPDRPEDDYDEDDDDDSSFFDRASEYETNRRNNTSQMYDDEDIEDEDDDDDESDEAVPLEVRRRRPSVSVTVTSPPSSSEIERN